MRELAGRCLADRDHLFQLSPLFSSQGNSVLLHGNAPFLEGSVLVHSLKLQIAYYLSIED